MGWTSNTVLNMSDKSGDPCLIPDFRGKTFVVEYDISCEIVINSIYYIKNFSLYTNFDKSVCYEKC